MNSLRPCQLRFLTLLHMERATGDDAVDWAICELESGNDSAELRQIAGTRKPILLSDVSRDVERVFQQLKYSELDLEAVKLAYVTHLVINVAWKIADGQCDPLSGRDEICGIFNAYQFDLETPGNASLYLFEWFEMVNGFHPESLDPTAEPKLISEIRRYALRLLEEHDCSNIPTE